MAPISFCNVCRTISYAVRDIQYAYVPHTKLVPPGIVGVVVFCTIGGVGSCVLDGGDGEDGTADVNVNAVVNCVVGIVRSISSFGGSLSSSSSSSSSISSFPFVDDFSRTVLDASAGGGDKSIISLGIGHGTMRRSVAVRDFSARQCGM